MPRGFSFSRYGEVAKPLGSSPGFRNAFGRVIVVALIVVCWPDHTVVVPHLFGGHRLNNSHPFGVGIRKNPVMAFVVGVEPVLNVLAPGKDPRPDVRSTRLEGFQDENSISWVFNITLITRPVAGTSDVLPETPSVVGVRSWEELGQIRGVAHRVSGTSEHVQAFHIGKHRVLPVDRGTVKATGGVNVGVVLVGVAVHGVGPVPVL